MNSLYVILHLSVMGKLMRVSALLIAILFFCASGSVQQGKDTNIDSTFINWNKATIASLRLQAAIEEQTKVIDSYKNRLAAFYAYINIKTDNQLNKNSIRYKFLTRIKEQLKQKNIFIIEANTSGEKVEIRNFVLYPNSQDKIDVEIYRYILQGWRKDKVIKDYQQSIDTTLLSHRVKWPKGFNNDDVIISHFQQGHINTSEFFLFGTLSSETIKKIISIE